MSTDIVERKAQIKKLVCEVFEVEPAQLSPTIMFVEELGVESLAAVELLTVLESEFAIEIEDDDVARMVNLDAVYEVVSEAAGWSTRHRRRSRSATPLAEL